MYLLYEQIWEHLLHAAKTDIAFHFNSLMFIFLLKKFHSFINVFEYQSDENAVLYF